ncbi:MAG: potassium/proton antiporter [Phycisphaerae bacterium]
MNELTKIALLLTFGGLLLAVSAIFSRSLERLGIPVVLLFLGLGMVCGEDGLVGIPFNDFPLAFRIGTIALILILFDGGFNTPVSNIRSSLAPAGILATLGVIITAGLMALFGRWLGLPWPAALLIGAIVSSTDAAAVFSVLRGSGMKLRSRVGTTLEMESGLNDPMALILTVGITEAIAQGNPAVGPLLLQIPVQLGIGAAIGLVVGHGARAILQRVPLSAGSLYAVLTVSLAFLTFGIASLLSGSGFLAVYISAIMLGNTELPYRSGLRRIHDALAWMGQITMFLTLGLLVTPSHLLEVVGVGLALGLILAVAARPLSVLFCLLPFRFRFSEIFYIGWVGLRGAVPIILAMFPVLANVPEAERVFEIVFFIVVVNAVVPGSTIRQFTSLAKMERISPPHPPAVVEIHSTRMLQGELMSFFISPSVSVCDASLAEIPFPREAAAILVIRGETLLAARGATRLLANDHVFVFCDRADRPFIELLFGCPADESDEM